MWNLPGLGMEPMSPALAVWSSSTVPLGKSSKAIINNTILTKVQGKLSKNSNVILLKVLQILIFLHLGWKVKRNCWAGKMVIQITKDLWVEVQDFLHSVLQDFLHSVHTVYYCTHFACTLYIHQWDRPCWTWTWAHFRIHNLLLQRPWAGAVLEPYLS